MKLFEPLTVRGLTLKNRVVFPPMDMGVGFRSRRARAYYAERARGGTGAIITSGMPVDVLVSDEPWGQEGGLQSFIEGLRQLTDDVHEAGGAIGQQLWHGNRLPAGLGIPDTRGEPVAPSPRGDMRGLTSREIGAIIEKFAVAAANARKAGFDFVNLHGAHGYLMCQFFSPLTNQRTDEYGGSLERRMRFGCEVTRAVREAVGPDYPVFFRMGARESKPGGIALEDGAKFAAELEKAGADVIDVSVADNPGERVSAVSPPKNRPLGTFAPLAQGIKASVGVPVIAVGRINTPEAAEAILSQGQADLVAIGRQLMADPFWPKKVLEGRVDQIVACDSCNINCWAHIHPRKLPPGAPQCKVNERVGREWEIPAPE